MNTIQDHVKNEVDTAQRQFRRGVIILVVITIGLIAYFQWIKGKMGVLFDPANLAEVGGNVVQDTLDQNKTDLVTASSGMFVTYTTELVRMGVQQLFRDESREITGAHMQASTKMFEEIVRNNKGELLEFAANETTPGQYTNPLSLANGWRSALHRELSKKYNDVPKETAQYKMRRSLSAMKNTHKAIERIGEKHMAWRDHQKSQGLDKPARWNRKLEPSRKDKLTYSFIRGAWHLIKKGPIKSTLQRGSKQHLPIPKN